MHAGSFSDSAAIIFYPSKVLGCFVDGVAVLTNKKEKFSKIYQLHDHGRDENGEVQSWGRNSRLDNLNAAFLNFKLEKYQTVIKRRREIASLYHEKLIHLSELRLPPPPIDDGINFDVYQNYEIVAERRDMLKEFLKDSGIGTLIQWSGKAVHQWEILDLKYKLPKVEDFFEKCIMLPMNIFISDSDVEYICEKIVEFYSKNV